jgi:hypothetical protein
MSKRRIVTNYRNIGVYLLFIVLFRPYFLPSPVYQIIKVFAACYVFIYVIIKHQKLPLINISVAVSASIILSSAVNYFLESNATWRQLFDAVIYGILFYDVYTLFQLYETKDKALDIVNCLLKINLAYCISMIALLNHPIGIDPIDYNLNIYIFGNKFTSSYLFLQVVALYYMRFAETIIKDLVHKIVFFILIILSVFVSFYYGCATTLIANIIPVFIYLNSKRIRNLFYKPGFVLTTICTTTAIPFLFDRILLNPSVRHFVINVLHRNINLSGRMNIYHRFLLPLIFRKPVLGFGYSNSAMRTASTYYTNAQNALLEHIVKYGILGGLIIIVYILFCFRQSKRTLKSDGALMIVYSMFIVGIVEISYNWVFFLGLSLLAIIGEKSDIGSTKTIQRKRRVVSSDL